MAERERATRAAEKLKEEYAQRVLLERELEQQKVCTFGCCTATLLSASREWRVHSVL